MVDQWRYCNDLRSGSILVCKPKIRMAQPVQINDRVKIYLDSKFGEKEGWYEGTVIRIDPYSRHRSFYWVELNADAQVILGSRQISVINPKNIKIVE